MPRQFNTDDLRKALDQYADYDQQTNYSVDDAREALLERALENDFLNDYIEDQLREYRSNEDYDYDPDEYISPEEVQSYSRRMDASDFPERLPYSRDLDIDPDLEDLNVYNFVNENPKAREFLTTNAVQFNPEEAGNRFLRSLRAGSFTPEQLRTLRALRFTGNSRILETVPDDELAYEAANFINRAATGRDVAPVDPIYDNTSETLDRIQDLASIEQSLRDYSESVASVSDRLRRYQTGELGSARAYNTSPSRGTETQTVLPLVDQDPTQGRLNLISSAFQSLPTSFNTVQELTDARNRLTNIQRDLGSVTSVLNDPTARRDDFIRRSVLPQVEAALGPRGTQAAVTNAIRETVRNRQEEEARTNPDNLHTPRSNTSTGIRGRVYPSPSTSIPLLERTLGMEPIPGLNEQLQKEKLDNLQKTISEFPEVERLLKASLKTSERPPLRGASSKVYTPYVDTEQVISMPEDRVAMYKSLLENDPEFINNPSKGLDLIDNLEKLYTSGDPALQKSAFETLDAFGYGDKLRNISVPASSSTRPIIGGGGYVGGERDTEEAKALRKRIEDRATKLNSVLLDQSSSDFLRSQYPDFFTRPSVTRRLELSYDPDTDTVAPANPGDRNVYGIDVSTGNPAFDPFTVVRQIPHTLSLNALRFLADNPILGSTSVSFTTKTPSSTSYSYDAKQLPPAVSDAFGRFAQRTALQGLPPGTLVTNSPVSSYDLLNSKRAEGLTSDTSSTIRKLEPFEQAGHELPNLRAAAYQTAGFGPYDSRYQYSYIDAQGQAVPLQLYRSAPGFSDSIRVSPTTDDITVAQGRLPLATKAYYSADPIATLPALGAAEFGRALRRTPSALLPGVADLIPSPEAIRTAYREGPAAGGRQMGQEFIQSLPTAAAAAGVLSLPAVAPFAPGIGAGMVGVAGARALNEVVKQETGEGIVPKLRQVIGTEPRSGVASPTRQGPVVTPQIRPLTPTQRTEMQRRQNRNELQRRIDLMGERFNPAKGEFGLTELLFGR